MIEFIKKKIKFNNLIFFITNYTSFGLQVLIGFLIFITIYLKFGSAELGVFIQVYTLFIILGQFSVFGMNESILQKISSNNNEKYYIFFNAFLSTLTFLVFFITSLFFILPYVINLFESEKLKYSSTYLFLAIFIFGLNKISFSYFVSIKKLNYFAFLNFLRPLIILLAIIFYFLIQNEINYSLCFLISEILIFLSSYINIFKKEFFSEIKFSFNNYLNHFNFGSKVFANSLLNESFIRIDIIIIGLLLSDKDVGIYALAALFLEGVYQFAIVIRNILNPDLGYLYSKNQFSNIIKICQKFAILSVVIISLISFILFLSYEYLLFFIDNEELLESKNILSILLLGLIAYSIIIPSENLLFQANKPFVQSLYMVIMTLLNIILNFTLINNYGLMGAAFATSITFMFSLIIFNISVILSTELKYGIFLNYKKN